MEQISRDLAQDLQELNQKIDFIDQSHAKSDNLSIKSLKNEFDEKVLTIMQELANSVTREEYEDF